MKIQFSPVLGFLYSLLLVSVAIGESYLCISDMETGFYFDNNRKEWNATTFKAGDKYIISKPTSESLFKDKKWEVKQIGEKYALLVCDDFDKFGTLHCTSGAQDFRMSKKTLRFLYAYLAGYWSDPSRYSKEGADTPRIAIGKCSPL